MMISQSLFNSDHNNDKDDNDFYDTNLFQETSEEIVDRRMTDVDYIRPKRLMGNGVFNEFNRDGALYVTSNQK